jgi:hypothetical protein
MGLRWWRGPAWRVLICPAAGWLALPWGAGGGGAAGESGGGGEGGGAAVGTRVFVTVAYATGFCLAMKPPDIQWLDSSR